MFVDTKLIEKVKTPKNLQKLPEEIDNDYQHMEVKCLNALVYTKTKGVFSFGFEPHIRLMPDACSNASSQDEETLLATNQLFSSEELRGIRRQAMQEVYGDPDYSDEYSEDEDSETEVDIVRAIERIKKDKGSVKFKIGSLVTKSSGIIYPTGTKCFYEGMAYELSQNFNKGSGTRSEDVKLTPGDKTVCAETVTFLDSRITNAAEDGVIVAMNGQFACVQFLNEEFDIVSVKELKARSVKVTATLCEGNLPIQNGKLYSYPTKTVYGDDGDADESVRKNFCMTYRGRFYYSVRRKDGSMWLGCCDKQSKWNYPFYLQGLSEDIAHLNYNDRNTVVTLTLNNNTKLLVEATQHKRDHARPRTFSWSYFQVQNIEKSNFKNPMNLTDSCAVYDDHAFYFMGKERSMNSLLNQIDQIPDNSIDSSSSYCWRNLVDEFTYITRPNVSDVQKVQNLKEDVLKLEEDLIKFYDEDIVVPDNIKRLKLKDAKVYFSSENANHVTWKRKIWKQLVQFKIDPKNYSKKALIKSVRYAVSLNNFTAACEIYELYKKMTNNSEKHVEPKLECNMIGRPDRNLLMDIACDPCTKFWTGEDKFVDLWIYDVPSVGMVSGEGACIQCIMGNLQSQFACTKNLPGNDGHQWFCDTRNQPFLNTRETGSQRDRKKLFMSVLEHEPEYLTNKVWFMNGQLLLEVLIDLYAQQKFEQLQYCIKYGDRANAFRDPISDSHDVLHKEEFPSPPFFLEWAMKQVIGDTLSVFTNKQSTFDMLILDKLVNAALSFNAMDAILIDFVKFPVIQESLMRIFILLDEDKDDVSDELPPDENAMYWTRRHLQGHTFGSAAKTKSRITDLLITSSNGISSSELLEKQICTAEKFLKQIRLSIVKPIRMNENQFDPIRLHTFLSRRSEHLLDRVKHSITEMKYITYDRESGHNDLEAVQMSKCLKTCQFIVPLWKKQVLHSAYGASPGTKQVDAYKTIFEVSPSNKVQPELVLNNYRTPSDISRVPIELLPFTDKTGVLDPRGDKTEMLMDEDGKFDFSKLNRHFIDITIPGQGRQYQGAFYIQTVLDHPTMGEKVGQYSIKKKYFWVEQDKHHPDLPSYHQSLKLLGKKYSSLLYQAIELMNVRKEIDEKMLHKVDQILVKSWDWITGICDRMEEKLVFGAKQLEKFGRDKLGAGEGLPDNVFNERGFHEALAPLNYPHLNTGESQTLDNTPLAIRDFQSYLLSLMRWSSGDHEGHLPVMMIQDQEHTALIIDALLAWKISSAGYRRDKKVNQLNPEDNFFTRGQSVIVPGVQMPDLKTEEIDISIPYAVHSNLLVPGKRRDEVMNPANLMKTTQNQPVIPSLDEDESEAIETDAQSPTESTFKIPELPRFDAGKLITEGKVSSKESVTGVESEVTSFFEKQESTSECTMKFNWIERWEKLFKVFSRMFPTKNSNSPLRYFQTYANFCEAIQRDIENETISKWSGTCSMMLDGDKILTSFSKFVKDTPEKLKASKYDIKFKRGDVEDLGEGTGLLRQFLEDMIAELKETSQLIPVNSENTEFLIPADDIKTENIKCLAVVMGIALATKNHIPLKFTRCFTKLLLNREIKFYDIAFDDKDLFEGMRKGMALGKEDFGYISEQEIYEQCKEDLKLKVLQPTANLLRATLLDFIPESIISNLTAESFSLLISGVKKVDIKQFKKDVSFKNPRGDVIRTDEKPIIAWFWEILENELTESEMHFLLFFWTGSSMIPLQWHPSPKVQIEPVDVCNLPSAQTCTNLLRIPDYESKESLLQKLRLAIANCRTFGII
jgi:hypothetical protein